jgi:hypothetical protein
MALSRKDYSRHIFWRIRNSGTPSPDRMKPQVSCWSGCLLCRCNKNARAKPSRFMRFAPNFFGLISYTARPTTMRLPPAGQLNPASVMLTSARSSDVNNRLIRGFKLNSLSILSLLSLPLPLRRLTIMSGSNIAVNEVENRISKPLRPSFVSSSPRR